MLFFSAFFRAWFCATHQTTLKRTLYATYSSSWCVLVICSSVHTHSTPLCVNGEMGEAQRILRGFGSLGGKDPPGFGWCITVLSLAPAVMARSGWHLPLTKLFFGGRGWELKDSRAFKCSFSCHADPPSPHTLLRHTTRSQSFLHSFHSVPLLESVPFASLRQYWFSSTFGAKSFLKGGSNDLGDPKRGFVLSFLPRPSRILRRSGREGVSRTPSESHPIPRRHRQRQAKALGGEKYKRSSASAAAASNRRSAAQSCPVLS